MDAPDSASLLTQAMAAVNVGDLVQGRTLLEQILENDPRNEWAWIWLSGCVQEPLQRRICLQQALKANPQNQVAVDGMRVLDGELAQASSAAPSLLESRLAAIGMGERDAAAPSSEPAPESGAAIPNLAREAAADASIRRSDAQTAPKPRKRGLLVLLILLVLLLAVLACGLVVWRVVLPRIGSL